MITRLNAFSSCCSAATRLTLHRAIFPSFTWNSKMPKILGDYKTRRLISVRFTVPFEFSSHLVHVKRIKEPEFLLTNDVMYGCTNKRQQKTCYWKKNPSKV